MIITENTPIFNLTVGQLRQVLNETGNTTEKTTQEAPRYVYGIKGIQQLFGVSKKTAWDYKNTILKDAVYQYGRKIVVDVEKAVFLFSKSKPQL